MPNIGRILITSVILLLIVGLVEWGAYRNVQRVWGASSRWNWIKWSWRSVTLIQVVWTIIYFVRWPHWREFKPEWLLLTHAVLISLLIPKLFLSGIEAIEGVRFGFQWLFTSSEHKANVPRRTFISIAGQASAGLLLGAFAHGMTFGRRGYHVRRYDVPMSNLPEALDGVRIVQISDAHLGSFLNQFDTVEPGLKMVRELKPDLLCFTGDLVNDHSDEAEPWISRFRELEGRYGKFSILGNHDYADYARRTDEERETIRSRTKAIHGEMGFDLLLNEHRVVEINGEQLLLLGVENWGRGFRQSGDLDAARNGTLSELPTVLLSHDPTHWEEKVMGDKAPVELTLSGHTHGMQFGIELGSFKWSPAKYRYPQWAGLHTKEEKNLYVNRGLGHLGYAGRVGIYPEITVFNIHSLVS